MVKIRQALWTFLICSIFAVTAVFAQSTLTQIQDTVTNADGSPFSGTVVITWNGSTGPSSGTTPLSTSAHVYNGALSVLLVPTTTASSLSFYQVVYYSASGVLMWSETWQVPPSASPLTLSAVRTSSSGNSGSGGTNTGTGTSGGSGPSGNGQYATLPISISQVTSLSADLASINGAVAAVQAQVNSALSSAVQVNASFVDAAPLSGPLNGTNAVFAVSQVPITGSLAVYRNGLLQTAGVDYTLSGSTLTFMPNSVPRSNDILSAYYRVAGGPATVTFVDSEVPNGTIDGNNTSFTLANAPNPPASLKLYKNGVLLNQGGDYTVSGSNINFANTVVTPKSGDMLIAAYRH